MKKIISIFVVLTTVSLLCRPFSTQAAERPLRGVWVSSVLNLDYPSKAGLSVDELRAEADSIIAVCRETGMTAVFLQVRPCADALYNSSIFPSSIYLTGESSYDTLAFDPLEYFIEQAHRYGIELHAWINPYRVTKYGDKDYERISESSPAKLHPEYLLKTADGNRFFNPALPEVRQLICDGVSEILENYAVDGIHLDDYFYPDSAYDDSAAYAEYGAGFGDADEWRRENVNMLVRQLHDLIKETAPSVSFGISPRGIWANNYDDARGSATRGNGSFTSIYCDSLRFIEEGWVDYICPQIYWNIGYSVADYEILVPWWANAVRGTDVKLYIGMADYRTDGASEGSAWYGTAELKRQHELNKTYPEISGEVHFRYGTIAENPSLIELYSELYKQEYQSAPAAGEITPAEKVKEAIMKLLRRIVLG